MCFEVYDRRSCPLAQCRQKKNNQICNQFWQKMDGTRVCDVPLLCKEPQASCQTPQFHGVESDGDCRVPSEAHLDDGSLVPNCPK